VPPVEPDYFADDDDYVEYTVERDHTEWDEPVRRAQRRRDADVLVYDLPNRDILAPDDTVTTPFAVHVEHPLHAPAETWHGGRVETWESLMDRQSEDVPAAADDDPITEPVLVTIADPLVAPEPIPARNGQAPWRSMLDELLDVRVEPPEEFAHNGFHVEPPTPTRRGRHARADSAEPFVAEEASAEAVDAGTYGRHSMRFRD
jgi:hypothetical protein